MDQLLPWQELLISEPWFEGALIYIRCRTYDGTRARYVAKVEEQTVINYEKAVILWPTFTKTLIENQIYQYPHPLVIKWKNIIHIHILRRNYPSILHGLSILTPANRSILQVFGFSDEEIDQRFVL